MAVIAACGTCTDGNHTVKNNTEGITFVDALPEDTKEAMADLYHLVARIQKTQKSLSKKKAKASTPSTLPQMKAYELLLLHVSVHVSPPLLWFSYILFKVK